MSEQLPLDAAALAPTESEDGVQEIAPDLAYQRLMIVNIVYFGPPNAGDVAEGRQWVLIDAGIPGSAERIATTARRHFGEHARPLAIVLTHGHFDHVGGLETLAEQWDVPVYAHEKEHRYLNGTTSYPPPDPKAGGGMMSALSRFYPRDPVNVADRLHALPADGSVPMMPGWTWIHTSGHTLGHISLWRESDRTLIAGDAFITTAQESAYAVLTQRPEMHGPPMYFTPDWEQARESVRRLAALEPELVITGHGPAMQGQAMREALHTLADDFDRIAIPEHGRYAHRGRTSQAH